MSDVRDICIAAPTNVVQKNSPSRAIELLRRNEDASALPMPQICYLPILVISVPEEASHVYRVHSFVVGSVIFYMEVTVVALSLSPYLFRAVCLSRLVPLCFFLPLPFHPGDLGRPLSLYHLALYQKPRVSRQG